MTALAGPGVGYRDGEMEDTAMSEDTAGWTPGLLVVGQVLLDAARAMAEDEAARTCLKVRSGEHLAAIFLSGLFGRPPAAFDNDGGPDLIFDAHDQSWFPYAGPVAFEVKSLPGDFRRSLNVMIRKTPPGTESAVPVRVRLWTVDEVMGDAQPVISKAEQSLIRKTPPEYSRNVFLITHPFDRFVPEVVVPRAVSSLMPKKVNSGTLDSIWVYWPPDNLVMWSREIQTWTDILFVTDDSELPNDTLSFIQNAELTYLATAGLTESPYIFKIT
jgi:hypothetical protein